MGSNLMEHENFLYFCFKIINFCHSLEGGGGLKSDTTFDIKMVDICLSTAAYEPVV